MPFEVEIFFLFYWSLLSHPPCCVTVMGIVNWFSTLSEDLEHFYISYIVFVSSSKVRSSVGLDWQIFAILLL